MKPCQVPWKGNNGKTKLQYGEIISKTIEAAGVRRERTAKDVKNKISHIEMAWKANDYSYTVTGAGLKASDPEGSFKEKVEKVCPYYLDLFDFLLQSLG